MIIIAKNVTSNIIPLPDLGVKLPANGSTPLHLVLNVEDIMGSKSLISNIEADNVIINNGVSDLSKSEALTYVTYTSPMVSEFKRIAHKFGSKNQPYYECTHKTFELVLVFIFDGTNKTGVLTTGSFIAGGESSYSFDGIIQLKDFTNDNIIMSLTVDEQYSDPSGTPLQGRPYHRYIEILSNLPVNEAMFELYVKNGNGSHNKTRIYSVSFT